MVKQIRSWAFGRFPVGCYLHNSSAARRKSHWFVLWFKKCNLPYSIGNCKCIKTYFWSLFIL